MKRLSVILLILGVMGFISLSFAAEGRNQGGRLGMEKEFDRIEQEFREANKDEAKYEYERDVFYDNKEILNKSDRVEAQIESIDTPAASIQGPQRGGGDKK